MAASEKEKRYVKKILEKTRLFLYNGVYLEVEKKDDGDSIYVKRYQFDKNTDEPDLAKVSRSKMYYEDAYVNIKCGCWLPLYKDSLSYEQFVLNQDRYLSLMPRYFWYGDRVWKITDKVVDCLESSHSSLMQTVMVDAKDVLEGHELRFIKPEHTLIETKDGDKSIDDIEWIWNENDINVYLLKKIYDSLKQRRKA